MLVLDNMQCVGDLSLFLKLICHCLLLLVEKHDLLSFFLKKDFKIFWFFILTLLSVLCFGYGFVNLFMLVFLFTG